LLSNIFRHASIVSSRVLEFSTGKGFLEGEGAIIKAGAGEHGFGCGVVLHGCLEEVVAVAGEGGEVDGGVTQGGGTEVEDALEGEGLGIVEHIAGSKVAVAQAGGEGLVLSSIEVGFKMRADGLACVGAHGVEEQFTDVGVHLHPVATVVLGGEVNTQGGEVQGVQGAQKFTELGGHAVPGGLTMKGIQFLSCEGSARDETVAHEGFAGCGRVEVLEAGIGDSQRQFALQPGEQPGFGPHFDDLLGKTGEAEDVLAIDDEDVVILSAGVEFDIMQCEFGIRDEDLLLVLSAHRFFFELTWVCND